MAERRSIGGVTLTLRAADGTAIAADLLVPVGRPRATAVLAPALGVRRGFYRPLAQFLADAGIAVVVPDYRGIGDSRPASLRGFRADLGDWADDLAAAAAHLRAAFPDLPLTWLGHSMGGQLLGVLRDPPVRRALLVSAQHGHWRNWPGWPRYGMAALWWAVIPIATRVAGRLPMRAFGQGEDVPAGVARQWARWGRDRRYAVGFARGRSDSGFDRFAGALRAYAISDDRYAPASTIRPLVAAFTAARTELREVTPAQYGLPRLGHFGPFRPTALPLWEEWRDWLLAA